MECGQPGVHSLPARNHVEAELEEETGSATTLPLLMVDTNVQDQDGKRKTVTSNHAHTLSKVMIVLSFAILWF